MTNFDEAFTLGDGHVAQRILGSQKLQQGSVYLDGDDAPTPNQVAAVLHALADHSLINLILSDTVKELGADRADMGEQWVQSTGVGRWLQKVGDEMNHSTWRK